MIEVVQAFDRAPITALKTDDASALESKCRAVLGPWGAMEQWMQLRFIVRGIGHRAATIWASSTATLFILFAAATGTAFVSTRFGCLQPDCLPAEGAAIQSPQQSLALGQDGI